MIWVLEHWHLKPGTGDVTAVLQEMDDLLGPAAHAHPGWCGHARFFSRLDDGTEAMMLYPWRSRDLHEDLARGEEPKLADFFDRYCTKPREIIYYDELPVDVDDDHDHGDGHADGHGAPDHAAHGSGARA